MFRALLGGGGRNDSSSRSSRRDYDGRSTPTTSSSRRHADSKLSAAATGSSSRKSTWGDDRDRGLGDFLTGSRRAPPSIAGESTASTYFTAEPGSSTTSDTVVVERPPRYVDEEDRNRTADRRRDRDRSEGRERSKKDRDRDSRGKERRDTKDRSSEEKDSDKGRDRDGSRRERPRTRSGDDLGDLTRASPTSTATVAGHFAAEIASPGFNQFPMQFDTTLPGAPPAPFPQFDPHVQQQFPDQFQPYRPPNPAGAAADYYGDQGQSVATQPGVCPRPPDLIVGAQPHLQPPSPVPNPPPEPSSLGQVGAAAEYYATGASTSTSDVPPSTSTSTSTPSKPSKPGKPSKPSKPSMPSSGGSAAAAGAVTYGISSEILNQTSSSYSEVSGGLSSSLNCQSAGPIPAQNGAPASHGMGAALGAATAGAAAGYMTSNHHQHSASNHGDTTHHSYSNDSYGIGQLPQSGNYNSNGNAGPHAAAAQSVQPTPGPPASSSSGGGGPNQPGSLAYHQEHHGLLRRFIDFWRDPEGVGRFEDYTEAIGVCKYCFEPGTTSRDAPRKHHYNRRRRSSVVDRYGSSTRVDKWNRYNSSDDESRRKKSRKGSSWWSEGALIGGLAGYVAKSLFSTKDFEDSYSIRSGHRRESRASDTSAVSSGKASSTSGGVTKRSRRSRSKDGSENMSINESKFSVARERTKTKTPSYKISRRSSRSRSRSRSSGLKEEALDAAVGSALMAATAAASESSHHRKQQSPERLRIEGRRKSKTSGFKAFFTAPSANRRKRHSKKQRGFFSWANSSSSTDLDLVFGSDISGPSVSSRSSTSSRKQSSRNVNAEILELGIAARELARGSYRKKISHRHQSSLRVEPSTAAAADDDDDWEDADSEDSVSSALAYGDSGLFGSQESVISSSGPSFWPWRSGSKKQEKKREQQQQQFSPGVSEERDASSRTNSPQQVYPVPTPDPSRFEAGRMSPSSSPHAQPPVVRPGPIIIQQPQPVAPVSQSVYYTSPTGPPVFAHSPTSPYTTQLEEKVTRDMSARRSNSSPVFPTAPSDMTPSSILKHHRLSTKDSATVQFDLTEEQKDKERRAGRREKRRQERREEALRLLEGEEDARRREKKERKWEEERRLREEAEAEKAARDAAARRERRHREKEDEERRQGRGYEDYAFSGRDAHVTRDAREKNKEKDDRSSSSWVGPAAVAGTIGAVAAASALADKAFEDSQSPSSKSRHEELREKRRSERRRAFERDDDAIELTRNEEVRRAEKEDEQKTKERRIAKIAASRIIGNASPVYDSYQEFFTPEELRHRANDHAARSDSAKGSPRIVEIVPASERYTRDMGLFGERDDSESDSRRPDLPWPIPRLILIEPTPPQSQDGSVRDVHSPVPPPVPTAGGKAEDEAAQECGRSTRVSWGNHQTHEYEVPTPFSEKDEFMEGQDHHAETVPEQSNSDSVVTAIREETGDDKAVTSPEETHDATSHSKMPGGFGDDPEFAATLAATAAMAGFDPAVVTDDVKYYRRDSPPGSELPCTYRSPCIETVNDSIVTDSKPDTQSPGETSEPYHFIEGQEFTAEPETMGPTLSGDTEGAVSHEAPPSIAREVIENLNEKKESGDDNVPTLDDSDDKRERDEKSEKDSDVYEEPADDTRSTAASAPEPGEFEKSGEKRRRRKSKRHSGSHEEPYDDDSRSVPDGDDDDHEHRRRQRRSKRDSGAFDETASAASSPAKIDDSREKRLTRSQDVSTSKDKDKDKTQEKKSGGFFSGLLGSSRSTVEPPSSSSDKRESRDVPDQPGEGERDRERTADSEAEDENYKSRRKRREERRRHRYEEIVESGRSTSEKEQKPAADDDDDRKNQDDDKKQSFLEERPEMLPTTTSAEGINKDGNDHSGASGLLPASSTLAAATGLGIIALDHLQRTEGQLQQQPQRSRSQSVSPASGEKEVHLPPKSRSRPPSVGPSEDLGLRSRRRSMMDSPTAVPLHFRKPPASPNLQHRQSVTSPAQSPPQGRRRPSSTEFKNAREYRPLWLVERHSSGKWDAETEGPLPSLPSSKTTTPSSSVEDLREGVEDASHSPPSWQYDTYQAFGRSSAYIWGRTPAGLQISTDRASADDADILDLQQPTPTPATYRQIGPPTVKKEKPKYEFHSPSELLQDPSTFHPEVVRLPTTLETLPSVESSLVGGKDDNIQREETHSSAAANDSVRPPTPPSDGREEERKPPSNAFSSLLTGTGFASVVDAAVGAAVDHRLGVEKKEKDEADEVIALPEKTEAPEPMSVAKENRYDVPTVELNGEVQDKVVPSLDQPSETRGVSPFAKAGAAGFAAIVDAVVAAAAEKADVDHKPIPGLDNDENNGLPLDSQDTYGKEDFEAGEQTSQEQPRELEQELQELQLPPSSDKHEARFVDVVEAALAAAENAKTRESVSLKEESSEEIISGPEHLTVQPAEQATVDDSAPITSASKKKKKKDKKAAKKTQSVDLDTGHAEDNEQATTTAHEAVATEAPSVEPGDDELSPKAQSERAEPSPQSAEQDKEIAAPVIAIVEEQAPVLVSASDKKPVDIFREESPAIENAGEEKTRVDVNTGVVAGQDVETTCAEAVSVMETAPAETEMRSSPTVEQPETNGGTPHMRAEPEEETSSTATRKNGRKKDNKKKRQSLASTTVPNEEPEKSEESTVEQIQQPPTANDAKVSASQTGESFPPVDSADKEIPQTTEEKEGENLTMTTAEKKKNKKDKKKRQSQLWNEEPASEPAQPSVQATLEPSDETGVEAVTAQDEVPLEEEQLASDTPEQLAVSESQSIPIEETPKEEVPKQELSENTLQPTDEAAGVEEAQFGRDDVPDVPVQEESLKSDTVSVPLPTEETTKEVAEEVAVPVEPTTNEPPKDEFEEFQSAKSKKKAKQEKKKRPKEAPDETTRQSTEASAIENETPQEVPPVEEAAVSPSQDEQGPREESAAPEVADKEIDVAVPTEASISQPEKTGEPPKGEVEEFQPSKSKKKAKKEKKTRLSLSLDEEPTPETIEAVGTSSEIDAPSQVEGTSASQEDERGEPGTQQSQSQSEALEVEGNAQLPTEEQTPATEVASTEKPPAKDEVLVEESQTTKSKKKSKKDKKKRQSLVLDEEPTPDSAKDSGEGSTETATVPPSVEEAPTTQDVDVKVSVSREESTALDTLQLEDMPDKDNSELQPPEAGTGQMQAEDLREQDGEFQSTKSKKKAKKDKKKRQPLSLDEEPTVTSEKPEEPTEPAIHSVDPTSVAEPSQTPLEATKAAEPPTIEKLAEEDAENFQPQSAKSKKKAKKEKKKRQSLQGDEVPAQVEESTTPAIEQTQELTITTEANPEAPETEVAADETELQTDKGTGDRESTAEAEPTPAVEPPKNENSTITSETEVTTHGENENQPKTPAEPEEEFLSAKAKRKMKKEKKKRQSLVGMEEDPAATAETVQEAQGEKEKEAGAEGVQSQEQDTDPLAEKSTTDDSQGFVLAKEKRKAKKGKKRWSVTWVDEVAEAAPEEGTRTTVIEPTETPATDDPAGDIVTRATSSEKDVHEPEPQEPETAMQETPVQADGKETFQSSDKIETGKKEKDFDGTNDMVSSQVEPRKEECPYPVSSPTFAESPEPEPEISSLPEAPSVVDQEARETMTSDFVTESQSLAAEESAEVVKDIPPTESAPATTPAAPEQENEEDSSIAPSKKNKKEKKKKRKSAASSVGEIPNPEEQTSPPAAAEETQESVVGDVAQETQRPSEHRKTEEELALEPEKPVAADGEDKENQQDQTTLLEEREIPTQPESVSLEASAEVKEIPSTSDAEEAVATIEDPSNGPIASAEDAAANGQEVVVSAPAESTTDTDVQPVVEEEGFAPAPSGKKSKKKKKRLTYGQIAESEESVQVKESPETKLAPVETMEKNLDLGRSADQQVLEDVSEPVPERRPASTEPAAESNLPLSQPPKYEKPAPMEATAEVSEAASESMLATGKPQEDSSEELSGEGAGEVEDFQAVPTKKGKKEKKKKGKKDTQVAQAEEWSKSVTPEEGRGFSVDEPMPVVAEETTSDPVNEPLAAPTADIKSATASVSLDPFDMSGPVKESADVDMDNAGAVLTEEPVSLQAQQESEERSHRLALEKEDDLAVEFGERPRDKVSEGPVSRKPSKKDKKKAKEEALAVEQTSQPESEVIPNATEPMNIQAVQEPFEAVSQESAAQAHSQNDEILLTRSSSKKKKGKKKRMDSLVSEPGEVHVEEATAPVEANPPAPEEHKLPKDEQEADPATTETGPVAKDVDPWFSIDKDKDRSVTANDMQQDKSSPDALLITPEPGRGDTGGQGPSLEREAETAVGEFEETTTAPVEPSTQPEESMSKQNKEKSKKRAEKEEKKQKEIEAEFVTVPVEEQQLHSIEEPESTVPEPDKVITEENTTVPAPQLPNEQLEPEESGTVPTTKGKKAKQALEMGLAVGAAVGLLDSAVSAEPTVEQSTPKRDTVEQDSQPGDSWVVSNKKGQTGRKSESLKDDLSTSYEQDMTGEHSFQHSEPEQFSRRGPSSPPVPAQQPSTSRIASIFPNLERVKFRRPSPKTIPSEIKKKSPVPEPVSTSDVLDISVEVDPSYDVTVLSDGGTETQERAVEIHWQDESEEPTKDKGPTPPLSDQTPVRDSAPSPVEATSKDRSSSILFGSSPSMRVDPTPDSHRRNSTPPTRLAPSSNGSLRRTTSIHGHHTGPTHSWTLDDDTPSKRPRGPSPGPLLGDHADLSPPRTPLEPIREHDGSLRTSSPRLDSVVLPRPGSRNSVGSVRSLRRANRSLSGDLRAAAAANRAAEAEDGHSLHRKKSTSSDRNNPDLDLDTGPDKVKDKDNDKQRSGSVETNDKAGWAAPSATEDSQPLDPPQLPSDLHNLLEQIPSSSTYDPVTDKGKRPLRGMTDVYEGWGETPNSPRSPTRPPSVRRRQSMQHLQELEARLDQLISENRLLVAAKEEAEQKLAHMGAARRKSDQALNQSDANLRDKEAEIARLTNSLEWMQGEVQRLTNENEALTASHAREVEDLRSQHAQLAASMEDTVHKRISTALADKDAELRQLRDELAAARQTVQELQQQIVAATADDVLQVRDEDYFENACQRLCQHVQHWVLRFSKHSDLRRCRRLAEVRDQSVADRFDNAMLDGSDVDAILADRVRRRDVFMAVVMAMIWEYIFTRYLFGMDREQRQKLKALEKQLAELGPRRAVAHWRALTLTLLSKRPSFAQQRASDTEAVALEIMGTLSQLLPPPATAEAQLLESLRGVLRRAADLAIEMRTQRAEYVMLPPLQPEYDAQGELARQVVFNASLMNERSGATMSNEALEAQGAIVRLVLFPLVVKKGNDLGEGDEEIVVCPAQVLVARPESDRAHERDRISTNNQSMSSMGQSVDTGNMI
ncbi:hypothetical protein VTN77DRAFT_2524 [Rasamsonia byssochlamydoides]|uniref:uncharacterized protein n=1 Tax=Rasamsonia byssochlamydoides TaxID=89139 RepID=UPI003742A20B